MNDYGQLTNRDIKILELEEENKRLKECIQAYKKYDSNRKAYYSKKLSELGQMQSYVQELEDTNFLALEIKKLKGELNRLNKVVLRYKAAELKSEDEAMQIQRMKTLLGENAFLVKKNKSLEEANKELIYKLYHENN